MNDTVQVTREREIAIVTMNNPPVNALSYHLRAPLNEALQELRDDDSVKAIIITCAGRTFIAGADITEFGKPMQLPGLGDLIDTLETIEKPTIAAIHGTALGGGLELALGCHYRVAEKTSMMGLPEVKLGLLPGAGGTQRLPRVIGVEKALIAVATGRFMPAAECYADGLADQLSDGNLVAEAVQFAQQKVKQTTPHIKVRDRNAKLDQARANMAPLESATALIKKKARGLDAPVICAQSVLNSLSMDFDDAIIAERDFFMQLMTGEQSKSQRHLFFAEREAGRVKGVSKEDKPRKIAKAGVIGAGTMGGGIAMSLANGGIPVTILEMSQEALDAGFAKIDNNYNISVKRGSMSPEQKQKRMALLTGTTNYDDLADCDLIIEAVFEEIGVKEQVFKKLDEVVKQGAILASNTSYLDVDKIASFTKRPQDVVGMHFFSPANVMKLLEIVRGEKTAPDVLATAIAVGKKAKKVPVVVGVCHGFVGNRMLGARSAQLEDLLLEGAMPQDIDGPYRAFGWPMGPLQMGDLAGLDIGWRTRKSLGTTAVIADAICEAGRFGQKTSAGFYNYEDGRTPLPDPFVESLIVEKSKELGIERRTITSEEIEERTIYPLVNEGAKILEEGIAERASDIDIVWINGYGFPIGKGGPMHWANTVGLKHILQRLEYWFEKTGDEVFKPSNLLRELASADKGFGQ